MTHPDAFGVPYLAALDRYDLKRDPVDHKIDPVLPENPGKVHAHSSLKYKMRRPTEPEFRTSPISYGSTLCPANAKVILPIAFDIGDPDACPACVTELLARENGRGTRRRK